jgi:transposase
MAFHYVGGDRDQLFLLPTSMREWLSEGHLAWFVIDVVARLDTSGFDARHSNDGPGRPAYDPDMMLALLFYAYVMGVRSSRRIEQLCRTDAAYRVICGNAFPDHSTVARFLVDHEQAIEELFVGVLRLCAAAGLVSVGTVAIDGTKVAANASLRANRDRAALRAEVEQMLTEAKATDASEDAQPGLFIGDELPAELATATGRLARLEEALAQLDAEQAAEQAVIEANAAKAHEAAAEGRRVSRRPPKDPRVELEWAKADLAAVQVRAQRNAAVRQARNAAGGTKKPVGRPPTVDQRNVDAATKRVVAAQAALAGAIAEGVLDGGRKANTTDPQSRIMITHAGFVQSYNAQAAVNEHQVVLAAAVTQQANDSRQYQPMVAATNANLHAVGVTTPIGTVLADAGYWSEDNATVEGPQRLIATIKDYKQRRAARQLGETTGPPPPDATPLEAMEHRLRTPEGAALYATRSHTVEPVFGDGKHNRGYRQFRRRGLTAVSSEWSLMNTAHNLLKLFHHHQLAAVP